MLRPALALPAEYQNSATAASLASDQAFNQKFESARALFNKAMTFARHMQMEEANRIYDEIIERFGAAEDPVLKEQVSRVPADRGVSYHF